MKKQLIINITLWMSLLFTTFIVSGSLWNVTVTGKYFYFAFAIATATLFTSYRLIRGQAAFRICLTDAAVLCLAAWVGISCAINRMHCGMSLWVFMLLLPLYIVIRVSLCDRSMLRPLMRVVLITATVEAMWGLLQLHGVLKSYNSVFAISGSFFNPGPYAGFLACSVPLALYCILHSDCRAEKILGIACLTSVVLVLPATMSRAAWLAVIAGVVPVMLHPSKTFSLSNTIVYQKLKSGRILFFVLTAFFLAGIFYGLYVIKKPSADGRMLIWRVSAGLVGKNPLTGYGLGSFQVVYGDAQAEFLLSDKRPEKYSLTADTPEYAFNEYIQITVEHGIIGLLLFLGIIYSFFARRGIDAGRDSVACAVHGSLTVFCVFAFFSYPFGVLPLTVLFVFLAAMSASLAQPVERLSFRWLRPAVSVLCLGMAGYASTEILSRYTAYLEWNAVLLQRNTDDSDNALDNYHRLYPKLNRQKKFLFEYARCLSANKQYTASNETLGRLVLLSGDPMIFNCMGNNYKEMGNYEKAENMYFRALQIVPNRHYPLYLLMKLYNDTDQTQKAKDIAYALLKKPVKVPSTAISEMQEEAKQMVIDK